MKELWVDSYSIRRSHGRDLAPPFHALAQLCDDRGIVVAELTASEYYRTPKAALTGIERLCEGLGIHAEKT